MKMGKLLFSSILLLLIAPYALAQDSIYGGVAISDACSTYERSVHSSRDEFRYQEVERKKVLDIVVGTRGPIFGGDASSPTQNILCDKAEENCGWRSEILLTFADGAASLVVSGKREGQSDVPRYRYVASLTFAEGTLADFLSGKEVVLNMDKSAAKEIEAAEQDYCKTFMQKPFAGLHVQLNALGFTIGNPVVTQKCSDRAPKIYATKDRVRYFKTDCTIDIECGVSYPMLATMTGADETED